MRPTKPKPGKMDRKHPEAAREPMEDIKDLSGDPRKVQNNIRYMEPNRDRALGEADRTGRHFDANPPAEGEQEPKEEEKR